MFRFKNFTIHQDKCAMKVTTDACILGAWACVSDGEKVLDIGTGTGLIALMLAQKARVRIEAVEINPQAALQSLENVSGSPFRDQISIFEEDIHFFENRNFDLVISNPPFFENQLQAPDPARNAARHTSGLNFQNLASIIAAKLAVHGRAAILLPPDSMTLLEKELDRFDIKPGKRLEIKHTPDSVSKRLAVEFRRNPGHLKESALCIYQDDGKSYSDDFKTLLKDYYLIF